ncbi:SatD family protein [Amphibacillus indicireducens]|uniref:SatD family protein n=1 Tax=Amphibacillus indicireducens TaxID=1076330 RepID=A0ABP7VAV3_9BACI
MTSFNNYVAIIGDISGSRQLNDRQEIQQKLKRLLSDINDRYKNDLSAQFTITLGDEFQGLLHNRNNIFTIITEIELILSPVEMRFGIGIGEITTDIQFEYSAEVDGPAYHRARKMIDQIEKLQSQYSKQKTNMMIDSGNEYLDQLLNSTLSLCTVLKSRWTARQKEIIYTYLNHNENQYKAAEYLEISQPSVNQVLNKSNFYSYKAAIDTVNSFLSNLGSRLND